MELLPMEDFSQTAVVDIPFDILRNEVISKIRNSLDLCNFQRVCKLFRRLGIEYYLSLPRPIMMIHPPTWLLELPLEIREQEQLWRSFERQLKFFPRKEVPLHLSLIKNKVRMKWYGSCGDPEAPMQLCIMYDYMLEQKSAGEIHYCMYPNLPQCLGCQHSELERVRRETALKLWNVIPNLEEYTWIKNDNYKLCFYIQRKG